ncbi:DMT family transporter [Roseivirga pacifica]|uniref:DMT family transporter n=1 Tax=Roseivirga pacifica TaxID=1267423 RepID=UPI002096413B|nr:DMT family transporter [Roseivirga pacifica]MCO6358407.1 EamA family transporter [Roseivirga pacifica]MCO6368962.1 EamA family transporter [Roseivirga pacifica]MCO6372334.1 EamA family transporter [Roseivirga pacifica]MCO6374138.1 EamA family transporter [Roseivirga pacifica]MCO6381065.1 EamA family transporter [Roseivirga pacifica]
MEASLKDYFKLHFIVFLWGFTAILGNEISISSADVVMYRTGIATLVLFVFLKWKKKPMHFERKVLFKLIGTGILIAAHWFLFFEAARVSTVSVCLAGVATATFWTSLIEPIVKKRRVSGIELLLGLLVVFGLYLIFRFEFNHALGLTLAIGAAILSATFSVINSQLTHKYSEYSITYYEMLAAAIGIAIFIPFYKAFMVGEAATYDLPNLRDWGLLAVLSIVCTVYAFSVSVELMKRISAFSVNLTINLEPVYGIIMALIIYGEEEQMSNGFYYGTLVILASVLSYPVYKRWKRRRAAKLNGNPA